MANEKYRLIHKRSNQMVSGQPKAPTSGTLEKGEIAINYNNSDPCLFIEKENGTYAKFSSSQVIADYIDSKLTWEEGSGEGSAQLVDSLSKAEGGFSVAEGYGTKAEGNYSHSEGFNSYVLINTAYGTWSDGFAAHAEGNITNAAGRASHAEGDNTNANNIAEHAEGRYNISHIVSAEWGNSGNTIHSVGIGAPTPEGEIPFINNKNAFEIMQNGDAYLVGVGGYDGTNALSGSSKTLQEVITGINPVSAWTENPNNENVPSEKLVYDTISEIESVAAAALTDLDERTAAIEGKEANWDAKQDAIGDLGSIRTGAQAGLTAVQPNAIADMATQSWVTSQGYLTEYRETDPIFTSSAAHGITSSDIVNWNGKADSAHTHGGSQVIYDGTLIPEFAGRNMTEGVEYLTAYKQDTLVSGENVKTINGISILGKGNIIVPTTTITMNGAQKPHDAEGDINIGNVVTQIITENGITGGTITNTGTIGLDTRVIGAQTVYSLTNISPLYRETHAIIQNSGAPEFCESTGRRISD